MNEMDTLFIQFMNKRVAPKYSSYCFGNGFSDTWYFCKDKGDFYWASAPQFIESGNMSNDPVSEDLPISKGNLFVSCFNVVNLFSTYQWAIRYPNLSIVAGGPAVKSAIYDKQDIPSNLYITDHSVEEYFGVPNLSQQWGLELPNTIEEDRIMFSYATNNTCYSRKCIFCSHDWSHRTRIKNKPLFEFKGLFPNNYKFVFINCPAATPKFLQEDFFNLPKEDDYKYLIFIRPDKEINKILQEVLEKRKNNNNMPDLTLMIGIDFLSDRMLTYIRKNHTLQDACNTLKILSNYDLDCTITTILGWPNLAKSDVDEAFNFFSIREMSSPKFQWVLNELQAKVNTYIYDKEPNLYKGRPHFLGPFNVGLDLELPKEQQELNEQIRTIFHENISSSCLVDRNKKSVNQYYNY
jgi:hypothetical protein